MTTDPQIPLAVGAALIIDELNQLKAAGQLEQALDPSFLLNRVLARQAEYSAMVSAMTAFYQFNRANLEQDATLQTRKLHDA